MINASPPIVIHAKMQVTYDLEFYYFLTFYFSQKFLFFIFSTRFSSLSPSLLSIATMLKLLDFRSDNFAANKRRIVALKAHFPLFFFTPMEGAIAIKLYKPLHTPGYATVKIS